MTIDDYMYEHVKNKEDIYKTLINSNTIDINDEFNKRVLQKLREKHLWRKNNG